MLNKASVNSHSGKSSPLLDEEADTPEVTPDTPEEDSSVDSEASAVDADDPPVDPEAPVASETETVASLSLVLSLDGLAELAHEQVQVPSLVEIVVIPASLVVNSVPPTVVENGEEDELLPALDDELEAEEELEATEVLEADVEEAAEAVLWAGVAGCWPQVFLYQQPWP